jgi:ABC-type sugar transport system permease subunit
MNNILRKTKTRKKDKWAYVFYCLVAIPCVLQVCIFHFYGSLESILLSFQSYNEVENTFYFSGFATWKLLFEELFAEGMGPIWGRSLFLYGLSYATLVVNLAISFFLYKKIPFSNLFKVILFLPSVIPGMAMVLFYKSFVELNLGPTIISDPNTAFKMLVIYGLWIGFGGGMITYCGLFARISPELMDAIKIDGGNLWTEFRHLAWPAVYPLVTVNLYTGLGAIFGGSPNTYAFFGNYAPEESHTIGYIMYSKIVGNSTTSVYQNYCLTSAASLIFGLIVFGPTLLGKHFFEKYDPNN